MGMYTALHLTIELKPDTPEDVLDVLRYMTGDSIYEPGAPDHPLFECRRWNYMLRCDSAYHAAEQYSSLAKPYSDNAHTLTVLSSFKNYDNEIDKFVDWISPYIYEGSPKWIGYSWYVEVAEPTMLYRKVSE